MIWLFTIIMPTSSPKLIWIIIYMEEKINESSPTNQTSPIKLSIQKAKYIYQNGIHPTISIMCQFILWYILMHTAYWSIEQLRFMWCVPCGFSGYFQSLIVNQSLVCKLLTETSKIMGDYQWNTITMLSSFVGLKEIPTIFWIILFFVLLMSISKFRGQGLTCRI